MTLTESQVLVSALNSRIADEHIQRIEAARDELKTALELVARHGA